MSYSRLFALTLLALIGFAANPLLARLALKETAIDPASFTTIRLVSGALALALIVRLLNARSGAPGDWRSALALFAYAAALSYAYVTLDAAAGTLILFGAVQATMIIAGLIAGERLDARQIVGLAVALAGLVFLMLPGLSAPPLFGSTLMLASGIAWAIYSLRGRSTLAPIPATAENFACAAPMTIVLSAVTLPWAELDATGAGYALVSGVLASGAGYVAWYAVLPKMAATSAATIQLSVPVITAFGAVALLDEIIALKLVIASIAILGGIALVLLTRRKC